MEDRLPTSLNYPVAFAIASRMPLGYQLKRRRHRGVARSRVGQDPMPYG